MSARKCSSPYRQISRHSVEKLAVDRYKTEYDNANKPRDSSVLELLLIQEHAKKYSDRPILTNNVNSASSGKVVNVVNTNTNDINSCVLNIQSNTKPVTDSNNNLYVGIKSGNMNQNQLISFVIEVIIKYTEGRPAALYMDSLGYQHKQKYNCSL